MNLTGEKNLDFVKCEVCNLIINRKVKVENRSTFHRRLAVQLAAAAFLVLSNSIFAQGTNEILTNAVDVISLPAEQAAKSLKVSVRGVVTASDPVLARRFFLQDNTSGVFVDNFNGPILQPGELVEVTGITYPGAYAPTITAPTVQVLGTAPLPPAIPVSIEQLMSGAEDSQRIEIAGIVRDARVENSRLVLDLATGGYRFRAFATVPDNFQFRNLVGSQVRICGTAAEAHNRSLRQLVFVEIYIPTLSDLTVEKREAVNPFSTPIIPLNNLAQYHRNNSLNQRVHVRGIVTLQNDEGLFLQDENGGLEIQSRQSSGLAAGDEVEAVGFPGFENFHPVLEDAVFRKVQTPPVPVKPGSVTMNELQNGLHHAEYITLTGKLIERSIQRAQGTAATVLVLQNSNFTFTAKASSGMSALAAIPVGSVVRVNGICLTDIDSDGKLRSLRLLVAGPGDIQILQQPSWLTPQRLLIGLAIVSVGLLIFMSWTIMISRKNSILNFLIREREKSQEELQQAHDQLEQRVKERTEQLKFEITARKEAEVQFKAVLSERTRLAQELHDTVEQTLTGIALQLDTAAKLYDQKPPEAREHLTLARDLMSRSQMEVRQSVWDLRRLVQEQFDLPSALLESARQMTAGTNMHVDLQTEGQIRALPEVVEENFLRISHEALTNAIKHSGATAVNIRLTYEPGRIILQIRDNGRGFVPQAVVGPDEGHFGLLGIYERVKRLGGQFHLDSEPGHGTGVLVEISLEPIQETVLSEFDGFGNFHEETRQNSNPDRG